MVQVTVLTGVIYNSEDSTNYKAGQSFTTSAQNAKRWGPKRVKVLVIPAERGLNRAVLDDGLHR